MSESAGMLAEAAAVHGSESAAIESAAMEPAAKSTTAVEPTPESASRSAMEPAAKSTTAVEPTAWPCQRQPAGNHQKCGRNPGSAGRKK
jgi:hypothetical protein